MWISALVCMTTKMAEACFAVATRRVDHDGRFVGGPISEGANKPVLAKIFAGFSIIAILGTGALVQSNSISDSVKDLSGIPLNVTGLVIIVLLFLVLVGGIQRIGTFAEKIVPFMALFYVLGSVFIIFLQRNNLASAFGLIISDAFSNKSLVGGASGSGVMLAVRWGLARGIFSNEVDLELHLWHMLQATPIILLGKECGVQWKYLFLLL